MEWDGMGVLRAPDDVEQQRIGGATHRLASTEGPSRDDTVSLRVLLSVAIVGLLKPGAPPDVLGRPRLASKLVLAALASGVMRIVRGVGGRCLVWGKI